MFNKSYWSIDEKTLLDLNKKYLAFEKKALLDVDREPIAGNNLLSVRDGIATVEITSTIFPEKNFFTDYFGFADCESVLDSLKKALNSDNVNQIVIYFDSGGGAVTGVSEVSDFIFENKNKKPIYCYARGMLCSAAYWIGSACTSVTISDTAEVGSLGVKTTFYKRDDSTQVVIRSSQAPNKALSPDTEKGLADIQLRIDRICEVFLNAVARNRNVSLDEVKERYGKGSVFVGQDAVDLGLADKVSNYENFIKSISNNERLPMDKEGYKNINLASLKENRSDLYEEIVKIGASSVDVNEKVESILKAEQDRQNAIDAMADGLNLDAKFISDLKADRKISANEVAVKILAETKKSKETTDYMDDVEASTKRVNLSADQTSAKKQITAQEQILNAMFEGE